MISTNEDEDFEFNSEAFEDNLDEEDTVTKLFRVWRNERGSPELLDSPEDLIAEVLELINFQTNRLVSNMTSERGNGGGSSSAFIDCIYQMDLERIKFVLKSLIRSRLTKIERNWASFWPTWNPKTAEYLQSKLTPAEREYLESFSGNLVECLKESTLSRLPSDLSTLQDPDMLADGAFPLAQPLSLDSHVICKVKSDLGQLILDPITRVISSLEANDVFVLQYAVIKDFLADGRVELI